MHLTGPLELRTTVEQVLREHVSARELDLGIDATPSFDLARILTPGVVTPNDLARVWVDLGGSERFTLYLIDGPWERILVRHFERRDNPEITAEELGQVVLAALDALRGGARIGVARSTLMPAPPPPRLQMLPSLPSAPRQRRPSPWRLHGGAFYEIAAYGPGPELGTGPGALLMLEYRQRERVFGAAVGGQFRLPASTKQISAELDFIGGAARAVLVAGARVHRSVQILGAVGGGFDVTSAAATPILEVRARPTRTNALPVVRVGALASYDTRWLRLFAGLGLDVVAGTTRYLLATPESNTLLFAAWQVQPYFTFGLQTP